MLTEGRKIPAREHAAFGAHRAAGTHLWQKPRLCAGTWATPAVGLGVPQSPAASSAPLPVSTLAAITLLRPGAGGVIDTLFHVSSVALFVTIECIFYWSFFASFSEAFFFLLLLLPNHHSCMENWPPWLSVGPAPPPFFLLLILP